VTTSKTTTRERTTASAVRLRIVAAGVALAILAMAACTPRSRGWRARHLRPLCEASRRSPSCAREWWFWTLSRCVSFLRATTPREGTWMCATARIVVGAAGTLLDIVACVRQRASWRNDRVVSRAERCVLDSSDRA